ncbi:hypothetical protein QJS04_geneDACA024079 [Acorus gramineus]|uniref:Uncharacterized protein n=1 Tax=Acorus gramineus TaxID=55184 RepID=A0AAV9AVB0_ACOGR|nr:hypothetical protein QJS04_geneDACA024079 [Acorus gramineus]
MEENPSKPRHKRALDEDEEPKQKKPRFPKGKKVKKGGDEVSASSNGWRGKSPAACWTPTRRPSSVRGGGGSSLERRSSESGGGRSSSGRRILTSTLLSKWITRFFKHYKG